MKSRLSVFFFGLSMFGSYCPQSRAQEVPAGTVLEVRLLDTVSSHNAKRGASLHAVLVAHLQQEGRTLLPAGTRVNGSVKTRTWNKVGTVARARAFAHAI